MEFENEIFSGAPPRELPPRLCDVPHCGKMCVPTHSFDHTNVKGKGTGTARSIGRYSYM